MSLALLKFHLEIMLSLNFHGLHSPSAPQFLSPQLPQVSPASGFHSLACSPKAVIFSPNFAHCSCFCSSAPSFMVVMNSCFICLHSSSPPIFSMKPLTIFMNPPPMPGPKPPPPLPRPPNPPRPRPPKPPRPNGKPPWVSPCPSLPNGKPLLPH